MKKYPANRHHQHLGQHRPRVGEALRVASRTIIALVLGLVFAKDAMAEAQYSLNVLNLASDDVFFDDQCYYDFNNNIWGDINSEFNDDFSDNDPDFLQPGEYVVRQFEYTAGGQSSTFAPYEYWIDSQSHPVGTFGPYRYAESLDHAVSGQTADDFGYIHNLFHSDYRFKLTYGCRDGESDWEDVNDKAQVKVSPVFDYDQRPHLGASGDTAEAVAFAVIVDCDGTIGWGETFYEAYNEAMGVENYEWSAWRNENWEDANGNDREPLYDDISGWNSHDIPPGQVKDIQCRQTDVDSEWLDRTGISSPRVHTCSVDSGFVCQASEQIELYDFEEDEYWTPESCGEWEIRTLRYDKELMEINANTIAGGDLADGSLVSLHLSGQESGLISYQVTSSQTLKYRWTARLSEAINAQSEYDVKAGEWQSTGLVVLGSQHRNSVWGYTTNTSASIEVVAPQQIGQIRGPHLSKDDVVRLRVRYDNDTLYTFTYTISSDHQGKNWRWPWRLAQLINAQQNSTPVRAGEYSGTALTYPASSYRNKVWFPADDPSLNIVIDYNP